MGLIARLFRSLQVKRERQAGICVIFDAQGSVYDVRRS